MPSLTTRIAAVLTLALTSVVMTGCQDAVTQESFDQIQAGMTMSQVEDILGGKGELETTMGGGISAGGIGSTTISTGSTYKWEQGNKMITVTMQDGKVVQKNKAGF